MWLLLAQLDVLIVCGHSQVTAVSIINVCYQIACDFASYTIVDGASQAKADVCPLTQQGLDKGEENSYVNHYGFKNIISKLDKSIIIK